MITFKQFLKEARSGPLYHGTTPDAARLILKSGVLEAQRTHGRRGDYDMTRGKHPEKYDTKLVSLTRNFKTAANWRDFGDKDNIVLELDYATLSQRYKVRPIEIEYLWSPDLHRHKSSGLYEEYVVGDIKPIKKYLTGIYLDKSKVSNVKKYIPEEYQHLVRYRKF